MRGLEGQIRAGPLQLGKCVAPSGFVCLGVFEHTPIERRSLRLRLSAIVTIIGFANWRKTVISLVFLAAADTTGQRMEGMVMAETRCTPLWLSVLPLITTSFH